MCLTVYLMAEALMDSIVKAVVVTDRNDGRNNKSKTRLFETKNLDSRSASGEEVLFRVLKPLREQFLLVSPWMPARRRPYRRGALYLLKGDQRGSHRHAAGLIFYWLAPRGLIFYWLAPPSSLSLLAGSS